MDETDKTGRGRGRGTLPPVFPSRLTKETLNSIFLSVSLTVCTSSPASGRLAHTGRGGLVPVDLVEQTNIGGARGRSGSGSKIHQRVIGFLAGCWSPDPAPPPSTHPNIHHDDDDGDGGGDDHHHQSPPKHPPPPLQPG